MIDVQPKDRIWEAVFAAAFVSSYERSRRLPSGAVRSLIEVEQIDHCIYATAVADCAVEQLRLEEESKLEAR